MSRIDLPEQEILEKYNSSPEVTLRSLAEEYGVSWPTIKSRIISAGGKIKDPDSFKKMKLPSKEILEKYNEDPDLSLAKLGKEYNVSYNTIKTRILEEGGVIKKKCKDLPVDEIIQTYIKGSTASSICKKYKIGHYRFTKMLLDKGFFKHKNRYLKKGGSV